MFSPAGISTLEEEKHEVIYDKNLSDEKLTDAMVTHCPDILIVRSTKVTASTIDANPHLSLIIRAGAGYDTINVTHASNKGVMVANCPGKNSTAVAELTMGLILNIDRRLGENYKLLKECKWRKGMFADCLGLKGRTLGLIGFGNIAQRVAQRALAFEMKIVAYDVFQKLTEGVEFVSSVDDVLAQADIVSLHVPNLKETENMVNAEFLRKMKHSAVLINTARGELVIEDDLLEHLNSNDQFWYGTDVFRGEPSAKECDWEHPLGVHPRVYGSHHIGASTKQAEDEIGEETVRICQVFSKSGQIDDVNWVNKDRTPPKQTLTVKAQKGAKTYSDIFTTLEENDWTITSSETTACEGGKAVIIKINGEGSVDIKERLTTFDTVISVSVS